MSNLTEPVVVAVVVAVLMVLLRWTWGRGRSLVARAPRRGAPGDYGLLVAVAAAPSPAAARRLARPLREARVPHTVAPTTEGLRLMVWPDDAERARALLAAAPDAAGGRDHPGGTSAAGPGRGEGGTAQGGTADGPGRTDTSGRTDGGGPDDDGGGGAQPPPDQPPR